MGSSSKPPIERLIERSKRQHEAIATLLGQVKALETLATTLIASHPEPVAAFAVWNVVKPETLDEQMRNAAKYQDDRFRESFHASLARYERMLQTASISPD